MVFIYNILYIIIIIIIIIFNKIECIEINIYMQFAIYYINNIIFFFPPYYFPFSLFFFLTLLLALNLEAKLIFKLLKFIA